MKHIYITLIAILIGVTSFATSIKAVTNSYWTNTSSWNLNRLPQDNDTIIIPAGYTITIDLNVQLNNVVVLIYGTLQFNNGKLKLDNSSQVIIEWGGKITGINSNDQLTIGGILKFSGTQLSQSGYSFADNTTGTSPSGFVSVSLPVTFQSFYATRQAGNIQLNWSTSAELNNSYFEVERSTDGSSWKRVAEVLGAGTTTTVNKYSYIDKNISDAIVYYRIRQVDINGNSQYSVIRAIHGNGDATNINIYASSKQTITIDFNSNVKENVAIQVVNMNGQIIKRLDYKQASYRLTLNLTGGVGIYAVRISDGTGWSEVKKIAL
jgi:hypothetical protein